jgi:hypothetical protein
MNQKPRKVARPALPKGTAQDRVVPLGFNAELFRAITSAAKASKQSVSEWIPGTIEAASK